MSRYKQSFGIIALALLGTFFIPRLAMASVIVSDGFEGVPSPIWSLRACTTVSTDKAISGTKSLKVIFGSGTNTTCEVNFDLPASQSDLWIQYKLNIPSDYGHGSGNPSNNKFIRLWGFTYDDYEKIGASFWRNDNSNGYSSLQGDWEYSPGTGLTAALGEAFPDYIGAPDRNTWLTVRIHAKAATASSKGTLQIWKNGTLVINNNASVNNYEGRAYGYRYGYLMGWANAGYTSSETVFYLDDIVFATSESDLGVSTPDTTPPTSPSGLGAIASSSSSISVSWADSTDNIAVTGYIVERCQGTSCSNFAQVGTPIASFFVDSGLTPNTFYNYHVRAVDAAGNTSGWSNVVSATTQPSSTPPPAPPSPLQPLGATIPITRAMLLPTISSIATPLSYKLTVPKDLLLSSISP